MIKTGDLLICKKQTFAVSDRFRSDDYVGSSLTTIDIDDCLLCYKIDLDKSVIKTKWFYFLNCKSNEIFKMSMFKTEEDIEYGNIALLCATLT